MKFMPEKIAIAFSAAQGLPKIISSHATEIYSCPLMRP